MDLPHRRKMLILSGVLTAMLLSALDGTIVGPAMPTIVRDLGGIALLAWVFTVYSLASTIAVPIVGKLSDLYGRKWFYLGGILVFVAGSMLSGAAGEPWMNAIFGGADAMTQLIVCRAIQGLGGGMLMANGMALVGDMFNPRERGKYQGLFGGVFGFASVLGPAVGGWLTDAVSWRWIFYLNVPVGIVAFALLALALPTPEKGQKHAVDWWGALALATGLVPLLVALNEGGTTWGWTSPTMLALLGAAAVALALFVLRETRAAEPILSMRFFKDRNFTLSMTVLFFSGVAQFGAIMFLPLFQQVVMGKSASSSAGLLTPMLVSMVIASVASGRIISRTGRYKWLGVGGLAVAVLGIAMLSRLGMETSSLYLMASMVLLGAGIGVTNPLFTISMQAAYPSQIGVVTAAVQFFRSIGGTVGVALLGGTLNAAFAKNLTALVVSHAGSFGALEPTFVKLAERPESLLNSGGAAALMAQFPAEAQALVTAFLGDVQLAYASSIGRVFLIGLGLLVVALGAMLLLGEVPLTAHVPRASLEELGKELLAEEAVLPEDQEPEIARLRL